MVRPEHDRYPVAMLYQTSGCESRRGKHAGAPRSRLQVSGGIQPPKRSVESRRLGVSPSKREQSRGPKVDEPLQLREISTERRGGRADHVAAKATDCTCMTGGVQDTLGVWEGARGEGLVGNRRGPTLRPTSGEGDVYKPKVKGHRAERESEGHVVPMTVPTITTLEGRSPALVTSGERGKCEGMTARSNHPSVHKARELTNRLCVAAELRQVRVVLADPLRGLSADDRWTARIPAHPLVSACTTRRPSVSRVPEIGTHGLKGGIRNSGSQEHRA
jgi:hypothetical protein